MNLQDLDSLWDAQGYKWESKLSQERWNDFCYIAYRNGWHRFQLLIYKTNRWHPDNRVGVTTKHA